MRHKYHVYVILLDRAVLEHKRFREANPAYSRGDCVYIGSSFNSPDERFDQHKEGYKSNAYVRRYGLRLLPGLYEQYNPVPSRREAEELESYLADRLRSLGFAVWSH